MYNAIDSKVDPEIGLILVNDSDLRNSIMLPLQDAFMRGRLGNNSLSQGCEVPFVVVVLCNDKNLHTEERSNFIKNNENYVKKFTQAFEVQTPIFVVRDQIELSSSLTMGNVRMECVREVPSALIWKQNTQMTKLSDAQNQL